MAYVADVYFSEVFQKDVVDQYGKKMGVLWDMAIVPGARSPSVARLVIKRRQQFWEFPVENLNLFNRYVITFNDVEGVLRAFTEKDEDILIKKHVLDKQILDVNGAKIVRVNDLKLGEGDGGVCVMGIDVGLNGILRRIDGGKAIQNIFTLLNKPIKENIISWNYLQTIDPDLRNLTLTVARKQLGEIHPSDLAEILAEIPPEQGTEILSSVDEELAGEALHEVSSGVREKLLNEMDKETISDILEEMPPDEAADILGEMPEETSQELLSLMEKEDAEEVKDLLGYEEDTAGGLMTTEMLDFSPETTVDEALANMRLLSPDVEFIYYVYVVDNEDRLLGVVSMRRILTSPIDAKLGDLMTQNVKYVSPDADRKEIGESISKYDFIAIPVLDNEKKLLGVITVDDIIDLFIPNPTRRKKRKAFP